MPINNKGLIDQTTLGVLGQWGDHFLNVCVLHCWRDASIRLGGRPIRKICFPSGIYKKNLPTTAHHFICLPNTNHLVSAVVYSRAAIPTLAGINVSTGMCMCMCMQVEQNVCVCVCVKHTKQWCFWNCVTSLIKIKPSLKKSYSWFQLIFRLHGILRG